MRFNDVGAEIFEEPSLTVAVDFAPVPSLAQRVNALVAQALLGKRQQGLQDPEDLVLEDGDGEERPATDAELDYQLYKMQVGARLREKREKAVAARKAAVQAAAPVPAPSPAPAAPVVSPQGPPPATERPKGS